MHARLDRWRKQLQGARKGPLLVAFALLHELTAILPLPLFYLLFKHALPKDSFAALLPPKSLDTHSESTHEHSLEAKASRILEKVGAVVSPHSVACMAASYAAVKALLPVRIGLSLWLSPRL
ncbi:MAG: hypothetical protein SGCHY_003777 [Lobulomycetales sp.]